MGRSSVLRAMLAETRRQERSAQRRQRELARQAQEQEKLSLLERARLEVETHENSLGLLLSMHKEDPAHCDWTALASALPGPPPEALPNSRVIADIRLILEASDPRTRPEQARQAAEMEDAKIGADALAEHLAAMEKWMKLRILADGVLSRDVRAYAAALGEFEVEQELVTQGCSAEFSAHSGTFMECRLTVRGAQAIPPDEKRLSASGKVLSKPMPRARFHEVYQDYVCSCILRMGRELFSLLPIDVVLVTAEVESTDVTIGARGNAAVLSVVIRRDQMMPLNFSELDPSDAISDFEHRGDFKATRKSEAFQPISPIAAQEVAESQGRPLKPLHEFIAEAVAMVADLAGRYGEPAKTPPEEPR